MHRLPSVPRSPMSSVLAAALLGVLAVPVVADDLTVISEVRVRGEKSTATQYLTEGRVRTSDGTFDTILELDGGRMIHVDHKKKAYSETSLAEMREHFREIEQMLEQNPMLANMFGKVNDVEVEETGETRDVAGYPCVKYLLSLGSSMRMEVWATSELEAPVSYVDSRKMAYAAMGPMAGRMEKLLDAMKKIGGFPLATTTTISMMGTSIDTEQVATEVRVGPVPDSAFDVPAGYKKKKSPYE